MIDFELPPGAKTTRKMVHGFVTGTFRPIARKYDEYENEHSEVKELKALGGMMGPDYGGE